MQQTKTVNQTLDMCFLPPYTVCSARFLFFCVLCNSLHAHRGKQMDEKSQSGCHVSHILKIALHSSKPKKIFIACRTLQSWYLHTSYLGVINLWILYKLLNRKYFGGCISTYIA